MDTFYENSPDLREYFESLPTNIKNRILQSEVEISTLGELKQCVEYLKDSLMNNKVDETESNHQKRSQRQ